MCGKSAFLRINSDQEKEFEKYACYDGLIQEKLKSFNDFEREFVKTGYCPECQEDLFMKELSRGENHFFTQNDIRDDVVEKFINDISEALSTEKDLKNIIVQIEPVPYTTLYTYERGHSKALGGYYDFSLKDALRNKQLTVQLSFPSGSTTKEIDLHSQLEQVLKNSELPDGWYILNQNNDFPKEVHIDGNQIRIN